VCAAQTENARLQRRALSLNALPATLDVSALSVARTSNAPSTTTTTTTRSHVSVYGDVRRAAAGVRVVRLSGDTALLRRQVCARACVSSHSDAM
jgi:hypothetical protein